MTLPALLSTPELVRTTLLVLLQPDRQVQIQDMLEAIAPELDPPTQAWRDANRAVLDGLELLAKQRRAKRRRGNARNNYAWGWVLIPLVDPPRKAP